MHRTYAIPEKKSRRRIVQALIDLDIDSGELIAIRPDGAGTLELNKRIFELIEQKFASREGEGL
jgi:hypothetical protein